MKFNFTCDAFENYWESITVGSEFVNDTIVDIIWKSMGLSKLDPTETHRILTWTTLSEFDDRFEKHAFKQTIFPVNYHIHPH